VHCDSLLSSLIYPYTVNILYTALLVCTFYLRTPCREDICPLLWRVFRQCGSSPSIAVLLYADAARSVYYPRAGALLSSICRYALCHAARSGTGIPPSALAWCTHLVLLYSYLVREDISFCSPAFSLPLFGVWAEGRQAFGFWADALRATTPVVPAGGYYPCKHSPCCCTPGRAFALRAPGCHILPPSSLLVTYLHRSFRRAFAGRGDGRRQPDAGRRTFPQTFCKTSSIPRRHLLLLAVVAVTRLQRLGGMVLLYQWVTVKRLATAQGRDAAFSFHADILLRWTFACAGTAVARRRAFRQWRYALFALHAVPL